MLVIDVIVAGGDGDGDGITGAGGREDIHICATTGAAMSADSAIITKY